MNQLDHPQRSSQPVGRKTPRRDALNSYDLDLWRDFKMCPVCYRQFLGSGFEAFAEHWKARHARKERVSYERLCRAIVAS